MTGMSTKPSLSIFSVTWGPWAASRQKTLQEPLQAPDSTGLVQEQQMLLILNRNMPPSYQAQSLEMETWAQIPDVERCVVLFNPSIMAFFLLEWG